MVLSGADIQRSERLQRGLLVLAETENPRRPRGADAFQALKNDAGKLLAILILPSELDRAALESEGLRDLIILALQSPQLEQATGLVVCRLKPEVGRGNKGV